MAEQNISFTSQGVKLAGNIHTPAGMKKGERRAAFIVLHGFGGNKDAGNVTKPAQWFLDQGYVVMRFDFRGCGQSEGERGNIICVDQVENTRDAITLLQKRPDVDPGRIGVVGSSFGAAVAVYTGGVDQRVGAVISSGGWGDGERKFRGQHPTPEAWSKFTAILEEGKRHRAATGTSLMVPRFDIVPIPQHLRTHLSKTALQQFTAETAMSMMDFKADDVIGNISPRPVLLLHSSVDSVTPTEQSIEMFKRAKQPCDLHLFAETDHFMFDENNQRVYTLVAQWLDKFFPRPAAKAAAAKPAKRAAAKAKPKPRAAAKRKPARKAARGKLRRAA